MLNNKNGNAAVMPAASKKLSKASKDKILTEHIPMFVMLAVTFTALAQKTMALVGNVANGNATFLVDGLQLIIAVLLMVLGVLVAASCFQKLFKKAEK